MKYIFFVLLLIFGCGASTAQLLSVTADYPAPLKIKSSEYASRRSAVLKRIPLHSIAVFRSAEEYNRTSSAEYVFRQSNNLLYLSGFTGENGTLVLSQDGIEIAGKKEHAILFMPAHDIKHERWTGPAMGPAEADSQLQIQSYPNDSLDPCLHRAFATTDTLYYDWLHPILKDPLPMKDFNAGREETEELEKDFPSIKEVLPVSPLVDSLRMVKSNDELALMKTAINASCRGHIAAMKAAFPRICEYQLAATFDYEIEKSGCEGLAYPDIVGSGKNSCFLHYSANRRRTVDGDIVLMDCGGEYHGYAADITRTFPVNGKFSPEQRAIYQIVYDAQTAGIAEVKPGASFKAPHKRAFAVIRAGLAKLGIISDSGWTKIDPLTYPLDSISTGDNAPDVFRYFIHGTSHTLGLDVHDTYGSKSIVENEVMTVEPGIYIPEGSPCDKKWWNIGVRIEDDILVTKTGGENLSAAAPRTIDAIEALMKK